MDVGDVHVDEVELEEGEVDGVLAEEVAALEEVVAVGNADVDDVLVDDVEVGDEDVDELLVDEVEVLEDEVIVKDVDVEDLLVNKVEHEEVEVGCRSRGAGCAAAPSR